MTRKEIDELIEKLKEDEEAIFEFLDEGLAKKLQTFITQDSEEVDEKELLDEVAEYMLSQIAEEDREYYLEKVIANDMDMLVPTKEQETQSQRMETKIEEIISNYSDEEKLEVLDEFSADYAIQIAKSIKNDEIKLRAIERFKENHFNMIEIINTIQNQEKTLKIIEQLDSSYLKVEIAKIITNPNVILQAVDMIESDSDKAKVVASISIDDFETKVQGLKKIKGGYYQVRALGDIGADNEIKLKLVNAIQDDYFRAEIARTIDDSEIKLKIIKLIRNPEEKERVAETLDDEELKEKTIDSIQDKAKLDRISGNEFDIETAKEIKDPMIKLQALKKFESEEVRAEIAATIEDSNIKLQVLDEFTQDKNKSKVIQTIQEPELIMQSIEKLGELYIAEVAMTVKESELKLAIMNKVQDDYLQIKIVGTIEDKDIQRKVLQRGIIHVIAKDLVNEELATEIKEEEDKIYDAFESENTEEQVKIFKNTKYNTFKNMIAQSLAKQEDKGAFKQILPELVELLDDVEFRNLMEIASYKDNQGFIEECMQDEKIFNKVVSTIKNFNQAPELLSNVEQQTRMNIFKTIIERENSKEIIQTYLSSNSVSEENIREQMDSIMELFGIKKEDIPTKKEILNQMYAVNNSVIKSLNYELLDDRYIEKLGIDKINAISCFQDMQDKIINLSDTQLDVWANCIKDYMKDAQTEEWTIIAAEILDSLSEHEYDELLGNIEDIKDVDIDKLGKILQGKNVFGIKTVEDIANYENIKKEKTDIWIKSEKIEDKKLAVFEKVFGHDITYALQILEKYGTDIDCLAEVDIKYYVKSIKEILQCEFGEKLEQIYGACKEVTFVDKALAEKSLKTEFGKLFNEGLLKVGDAQQIEEGMYLAGTDFKMIITSVGAYIQTGHDSNYQNDWNRPSLASQHFCASYIRNDMIRTAPINDVCYGFDEMAEDSLMLSGATDIYSSGADEIRVNASHDERYYSPDNQINRTERYNEMDYRRVQNGKKKQPSYIVVFKKDGKIRNLENAKKAQRDWGNLPIVIVDVDACLESEKAKVDEMMQEYKVSHDQKLAEQIRIKIRNNRVTSKEFCKEIDIENLRIHEEEKIQVEPIKERMVVEEDLKQNFDLVTPQERKKEVGKMKSIFTKIRQIEQEDREIG